MPLIQINAGPDGPELHQNKRPLPASLRHALRGNGPVIIMVHGFKYAPGTRGACPHEHILALKPHQECRKAQSWPRRLGFGSGVTNEGLGIAFGWHARGTLWQAYGQAKAAGLALAELVQMIHHFAPHRPVHAFAHSFGARVVLSALPHLPAGAINRIILLAGAEFGQNAVRALDSDAGRTAEIINVTSRENDLYDFFLERLISAPKRGDKSLSHAMPNQRNTLTLQMDHAPTLGVLSQYGFRIAPPAARICHRSSYMRPGVFGLYRALLRRRDDVDLAQLRSILPAQPEPRWSRFFDLSGLGFPESFGWTAPS